MDTLGEDLVLLSIRPDNGTIATKSRLGYGLRGSELVRLAATGRVGITGDRIVVLKRPAKIAYDVSFDGGTGQEERELIRSRIGDVLAV